MRVLALVLPEDAVLGCRRQADTLSVGGMQQPATTRRSGETMLAKMLTGTTMGVGRFVGHSLPVWVAIVVASIVLVSGCTQQNEYLAEGKDLLKSNRRRRVDLAVEQFRLAMDHESVGTETPPSERAEARYLLAYYDKDLDTSGRAALFLESMNLAPDKFEDRMIEEALRDRYDPIREAVRLAIADRYASHPNRIRKTLLESLTGSDNRGRNDAAWVLGYLAADDASLRGELIKAMDDSRLETRLSALIAIEELAMRDSDAAQQAIPALLDKVKDRPKHVWWKFWDSGERRENPEVRVLAVSALGSVGATEHLLEILSNKGSSLRSNAMETLIESGASESSVDVLLRLLEKEPEGSHPWESAQSMGRRIIELE